MLRQSLKSPAENKRILSCERNLTPVNGTQIVICVILGRRKAEMCVKMHFSLVYKGLECVDLQERNRRQMHDQLKRRYDSQRKNSLLFLKFCPKKRLKQEGYLGQRPQSL